jgi:DNA phosphorothioation-associated DGQHR protein 1
MVLINMSKKHYIIRPSIQFDQPLGSFFVVKLKISELVDLTFSMAAYSDGNSLKGVQRKLKNDRIKQIAMYSTTSTANFPNSIILSANYLRDGRFIDDENLRWYIHDGNLVIPENYESASIIDGQHRVEGFREAVHADNFIDFDILCSVYIDMPFVQQAEVFTSINYNQKKIDKSVAYELFGYDLDETNKSHWSPDTLAIYLTRILNNDENSPLKNKIFTAFKGEEKNKIWWVSTACIVESISLLITTNLTKDRYYLHQSSFFNKGRNKLRDLKVKAPLREMYFSEADKDIYTIITNYLNVLDGLGWFNSSELVTTKAIGFIAIFEVLKEILNHHSTSSYTDINFDFMANVPIEMLNKDKFNFSGIGKSQIKNLILNKIKFN